MEVLLKAGADNEAKDKVRESKRESITLMWSKKEARVGGGVLWRRYHGVVG